MKPAFNRQGQTGQMGMTATHKYIDDVYWTQNERKEIGPPISNDLCSKLGIMLQMSSVVV